VTAKLSLELLCVEFGPGPNRPVVASPTIIIILVVVSTVKATSEILLTTTVGSWVLAWALVSKVRTTNSRELRLHLLLIGLLGHHHLGVALHGHEGILIDGGGASKLGGIVHLLRESHIHTLVPEHLLLNQVCSHVWVSHVDSNWHRLGLYRLLLNLSLIFLVVFFLYKHLRR
jgi:hypothetical protein